MKATITSTTNQRVKVNNFGGALTTVAPVTLKNQVAEINSLEDIPDVAETNVIDGATIVYNASQDVYEIKPLEYAGDIDGGNF